MSLENTSKKSSPHPAFNPLPENKKYKCRKSWASKGFLVDMLHKSSQAWDAMNGKLKTYQNQRQSTSPQGKKRASKNFKGINLQKEKKRRTKEAIPDLNEINETGDVDTSLSLGGICCGCPKGPPNSDMKILS